MGNVYAGQRIVGQEAHDRALAGLLQSAAQAQGGHRAAVPACVNLDIC
jgi:hypothetical protein